MPQNCYEPFKTITTAISCLARGGYPIEFQDCKFQDGTEQKVIKPFEKLRTDKVVFSEDCKEVSLINKANFVVDAYKMNHKIVKYRY